MNNSVEVEIGHERLVFLGGLMLGTLLGSIDQSIVGTALPTIAVELGESAFVPIGVIHSVSSRQDDTESSGL